MSRSVQCHKCEVSFEASPRQWKRSKQGTVGNLFCSAECQRAGANWARKRKHPGVYGPCPTCGAMFKSKAPKKFCTMRCYAESEQFKTHIKEIAKKGADAASIALRGVPVAEPVEVTCLECGKTRMVKPSLGNRRFCSTSHYRSYLAKRFDRWIASPEAIALPQAYDEFLTQAELPCLVAGCSWSGGNLSNHMNFTHGIPADEFKRSAGFNKKTGVVSAPTRHALEARDHISHAHLTPGPKGNPDRPRGTPSLEASEHSQKARLMRATSVTCEKCGADFISTSSGRPRRFCSRKCFDAAWKPARARIRFDLVCGLCAASFLGSEQQNRRSGRGHPVFCSGVCRQKNNSRSRSAAANDPPKPSAGPAA